MTTETLFFLPTEQSGPIQLGSQLQRPVSERYVPCPLHWSGHWARGSSQFKPPQPGLQRHSPLTQTPWLEQEGSKQSTTKKYNKDNKTKTLWKGQWTECTVWTDTTWWISAQQVRQLMQFRPSILGVWKYKKVCLLRKWVHACNRQKERGHSSNIFQTQEPWNSFYSVLVLWTLQWHRFTHIISVSDRQEASDHLYFTGSQKKVLIKVLSTRALLWYKAWRKLHHSPSLLLDWTNLSLVATGFLKTFLGNHDTGQLRLPQQDVATIWIRILCAIYLKEGKR